MLILAACLLFSPLLSLAQQNKLVVAPPEPLTVKRGTFATQSLKVAILSSFHVNSDKPLEENLVPFTLTWSGGPLEAEGVTYPKPEEIKVAGSATRVFTGNITLQTRFKAPSNAPAGSAVITGKIHYQACNNQMCFRPATVEVRLPVEIN